MVGDGSKLKVLGYFAVLESLLSHVPKPNDSADSITRQLKRNLLLLNNRIKLTDVEFGLDSFKNSDPDKVVSQLYALRSKFAHGGDATNETKWFDSRRPQHYDSWGPQNWITSYLRSVVQKVLQCALREPQLVIDLKG